MRKAVLVSVVLFAVILLAQTVSALPYGFGCTAPQNNVYCILEWEMEGCYENGVSGDPSGCPASSFYASGFCDESTANCTNWDPDLQTYVREMVQLDCICAD